MKKLLTALAVVAGLGFVMSCSDEVSDYTIGVPENGTKHEVTGTLTGTLTRVTYDEDDFLEDAPPSLYSKYYESVTVNGKTVWYRKVTDTVKFTARNATLTWTEGANDYDSSDAYYANVDADSMSYTLLFGECDIDSRTWTQTGDTANRRYYGLGSDSWAAVLKDDTTVSPSELTFKKVGDVTLVELKDERYVEVKFGNDGDIEDDTFSIASIGYSSKENTVHLSWTNSDKTPYWTTVAFPYADTTTLTDLQFTRYEK